MIKISYYTIGSQTSVIYINLNKIISFEPGSYQDGWGSTDSDSGILLIDNFSYRVAGKSVKVLLEAMGCIG